jgi:hypothetical protein
MQEIIEILQLNREDKCIDFDAKKCAFGCWNCILTYLLLEIIKLRKDDKELMDLLLNAIE